VNIKKNIMSCMTTITHTMIVKLSLEVVVSLMRWLVCEAMTSLSPPHHQKSYMALHGTTYGTADAYQCICSTPRAQPAMIVSPCRAASYKGRGGSRGKEPELERAHLSLMTYRSRGADSSGKRCCPERLPSVVTALHR
jgi:hypothetical protein